MVKRLWWYDKTDDHFSKPGSINVSSLFNGRIESPPLPLPLRRLPVLIVIIQFRYPSDWTSINVNSFNLAMMTLKSVTSVFLPPDENQSMGKKLIELFMKHKSMNTQLRAGWRLAAGGWLRPVALQDLPVFQGHRERDS